MSWPLPLSRDGLRQAARNPIPQPMPSAAKRAAEEAKLPVHPQPLIHWMVMARSIYAHLSGHHSCQLTSAPSATGTRGCCMMEIDDLGGIESMKDDTAVCLLLSNILEAEAGATGTCRRLRNHGMKLLKARSSSLSLPICSPGYVPAVSQAEGAGQRARVAERCGAVAADRALPPCSPQKSR